MTLEACLTSGPNAFEGRLFEDIPEGRELAGLYYLDRSVPIAAGKVAVVYFDFRKAPEPRTLTLAEHGADPLASSSLLLDFAFLAPERAFYATIEEDVPESGAIATGTGLNPGRYPSRNQP